jgi:hypothetical protein
LYPQTSATSIWNPARETKANTIQTTVNGTEEERFIFYRGLANFDVPLKVNLKNLSENEMSVTVTNQSVEEIPSLFYLKTNQSGVVSFLTIPALKANESRTFLTSSAQSIKSANVPIQKALVSAGLFEDEAISMLKTWKKSYFRTEGERLLYILPQAWTERILPMKLVPQPERLVRVLIGRVELFSQNEQQRILTRLARNDQSLLEDRLMEPKLNAVKFLMNQQKSLVNQSQIDALILKLNQ